MLIIRLARTGRKNDPSFRIVLQEKFRKPTGRAIEFLGFYNPRLKSKKINQERVKYWLGQGAQVSATVHNLLVQEKITIAPKRKASKTNVKPKKETQETKSQAKPKEMQETTQPTEKAKDEKVSPKKKKESVSSADAQPREEKTKPDLPKQEDKKAETENKK